MPDNIKEDTLYFVSIISAFTFIMFTDGGSLHDILGLPKAQVEFYLMFFSFFLIFNALVNRWLINPSSEEDHKKALNGLLLINSEEHLILGLVNISCLAYAHANHPSICHYNQFSHVMLWFLISRVLNIVGSFANRATGWNTFTTFSNAMSFFTVAISVGLALGFDSFLVL